MKGLRLYTLRALAAVAILAGACNKNGDPGGSTADPANTVEAWIPIGGWINFNNRSLMLTDQKLFKAAAINQLEFTKGISVKGLGNIKKVPASGYAWWTEAVPGCGYVVHLTNDSFYGLTESWARVYVVEFTYNEAHGITGVNIKYELNWWPN